MLEYRVNMKRLTYKSSMGDYGSAVDWDNEWQEIYALRNKLGEFEDNDWRSVKEDGNPDTEDTYEVTVMDTTTGDRYVTIDIFDKCNMFGFSINKEKCLEVVAWRNLHDTYMGE